jgi:hypothetical protein
MWSRKQRTEEPLASRVDRFAGTFLFAAALADASTGAAAELNLRVQEISNRLTFGYAVRLVGKNHIVAVGCQTKNVTVYWNETGR